MCRQDTPVPNPTRPVEEWAKQLRPSLMLQGLMDRHQRDHRHTEGKDLCFMCKEVEESTPASSWCSDCEVTLCNRCAKMHLKGPATKKHDMFDLSGGVKVKERRKVKCKEHEGEVTKFICKDCNKTACQTCCILKHVNHNISTIETIVPEIRIVLIEKKRIIKVKMTDNMTKMKKEESKIKQLKDNKAKSESEVKSAVNSAIILLREKERKLLKEIDDASDRHIADHQASIKSGQITNQMYQQHCEFIDQALQSVSEVEMYDMYQVCLSGAVESVGDTESETRNTSVEGEVKFTSNMEQLKKAITEMGNVDVTFLKRNISQGESKPTLRTLSTLLLQDNICITHTDDKEDPDPIDVTLLNLNGVYTLVVADYMNKCLKSIYKRKEISKLPLSFPPLSVAKLTGNRIAATLSNHPNIVVAEVRPKKLAHISTLTTNKNYWGLTSLSNGTLAAGLHSESGVDILDLSGNVLRSFTSHNTGRNLIQQPRCLCTTHEGNILVCDWGSVPVYCLTTMGDVVFTYNPTKGKLGQLRGITVTSTGDILLTQGAPYKIIQLSADGSYVRCNLTSTAIGEPCGLCTDDCNTLYVCNRNSMSHCINVFS